MTNEEYNKWLILYFDMQSINLQFNCNDIASSLKAQRDKIKQFCIDCLTGVKHQADSFLFDTNACIFSTSETRELLFSHEEYLILEAIKLFNSGTWYDTFGALKNLYYERTPKGLRMCNLTGKPLQANVLEHIEDIILNIKDHYETFAVVPRGKSKLQVYMTISNGTNGAEGCIINPMEDVLNVLKDLRKYKGVTWSQLLEVGIDNADDLYWWYVTFSIDTTAI